jgi:putative endonuclease
MDQTSPKYLVYALHSKFHQRIYVGMTSNIERRIKEHNSGQCRSTKPYLPWLLIFTEECEDRIRAREREKYWKSGTGKEQLKKLSKNFN